MSSPSTIITHGFGSWGSTGEVITQGYGLSGVVVSDEDAETGGTGDNDCASPYGNQDTQRWIPWSEEVVYTSVRPNSADIVTEVDCAAVYRLGNGENSPSYGVYTRNDILVTFDKDAVAYKPKPRDEVTWKEKTFTVLEVTGSDFLDFWKVTARDLEFASTLRSTGTLSRASTAKDSAFRDALTTYSTVTSSIPCRVQVDPSAAGDVFGRRTIAARYIAFLGTTVAARAKDRFTVDSVNYTVLAVRNTERIDVVQELDLELVP